MPRTAEEVWRDICDHPEKHRHDFAGLVDCCTIDGVVFDFLRRAHAQLVNIGENKGVRCDVVSGPCACGEWHEK